MDETVLVSDKEANRILALSFWNTNEDAEHFPARNTQKCRKCFGPCLRPNPSF